LIACTSPRTTELLHERCDVARFAYVGAVLHQRSGLGCQARPIALALGRLGDRLPGRLGPGDTAAPRDLVESPQAFLTEAK
jgi:hypothetical protein